jgi:hypothetical protein
MLVRKKNSRLKLEQQTQEAAIAEIEAILNVDSEPVIVNTLSAAKDKDIVKKEVVKKTKKKPAVKKEIFKAVEENKKVPEYKPAVQKKKIIFVKNQPQQSRYLVDLKRIAEEQEAQEQAQKMPKKRFFQNVHFSLPRHLAVEMNARQSPLRRDSAEAQTAESSAERLCRSRTAESLARGLCRSGIGFYRRHEQVLGQIFVINVIMLAGFALWRLGRIFYAACAVIGRYVWYTVHDVGLFIGTNKFTAGILSRCSRFGESISASGQLLKKIGTVFQKKENELVHTLKESTTASVAEIKEQAGGVLSKLRTWRFLPPHSWRRQIAVFAFLAILLILPLKVVQYFNIFHSVKGEVLGASEQAMGSLQDALNASEARDFNTAADNFSEAAKSFSTAGSVLTHYADVIKLANSLPAKQAKSAAAAEALVRSGESAAEAGKHLALAFANLQLPYLTPGADETISEPTTPLTQRLQAFGNETALALKNLHDFSSSLQSVDVASVAALPDARAAELARQVALLQKDAGTMVAGASEAVALANVLALFLGDTQDTRYLFIFQNNAEMRASGGFIGSYALIDFRQGEIKNIEVPAGGSYDLQGGLAERLASPKPLHLINSLWEFQDANWWPDWPRSAAQIERFFESGWGSSVDGVIAIDPTFVESLLAVTGPIDMTAQYGAIVTAENFYDIAQSRDNLADHNKPKEIIKDLVMKLAAELPQRITPDNFAAYVDVAAQALAEKHILINVHDEAVQNFIAAHGWDGGIRDTTQDYLAVINTNIAGAKTDRKIRQSITHTAEVTPDGGIIDTVEITREHTAGKGEPFAGVRNVNYLRLYVPKGSELIEASGFAAPDLIYFDPPADGVQHDSDVALAENNTVVDPDSGVQIYSEFGKTVFANWTQVDPGNTITIRFKYKLPFKIHGVKQSAGFWQQLWQGDYELSSYSLFLQKQAGSISSNFSSSLRLPANMTVQGSGAFQFGIGPGGWEITDDLRTDRYWGVAIQKE